MARGASERRKQCGAVAVRVGVYDGDRLIEICGAKDQTPEQRIQWLWRTALQRTPTAAEADALRTLYGKHLEEFQKDPGRSAALLAVGNARPPEGIDAAELAAWTSVARVVLNLHEVITRN